MNLKTVFVVNAVVALVFGLAFVLVPGPLTALYGADLTAAGLFTGRLLGAAFIVFGVLTWLVRDAGASSERRAILLSFFVGDVIGFVASLLAMFDGVFNSLGWSTVAIYLILALAFGYYLFFAGEMQPDMA